MTKFHSRKSFEESLADKAETFTVRPNKATWQGVENGLKKQILLSKASFFGILASVSLVLVGVFTFTTKTNENPNNRLIADNFQSSSPIDNKTEDFNTPNSVKRNEGLIAIADKNLKTPIWNKPPINNLPSVEDFLEAVTFERNSFESKNIDNQSIEPMPMEFSLRPTAPSQNKIRRNPVRNYLNRGWQLQVNLSPSLAGSNRVAHTEYAQPTINKKNSTDKFGLGYSFRVMGRFHFNDRLSLASGIAFSRYGERIGIENAANVPQQLALATSYGYDVNAIHSIGKKDYRTNKFQYLEIPLTAYLSKNIDRRIALSVGLGVSLGYLVNYEAHVFDYRINHYAITGKFNREVNMNMHMQALLNYQVDSRLSLMVGPELNYGMLSAFKDFYPANHHHLNMGLNLGLQYRLSQGPLGSLR